LNCGAEVSATCGSMVAMGKIHQIPTDATAHARLLEQLVSESIASHPDAEVAQRWSSMARDTLARFPGPPLPSQPDLNLQSVAGLDAADREALMVAVSDWLDSYFNDVRAQMMLIHRDLLSLQKQVAELSVKSERLDDR